MGSSEIRRTSDKIVESQLDNVGKVKSQDNGDKSLLEKLRQHIGPAFATLTTVVLTFQESSRIRGVEGSTPEASSTALALRGDNAMGLPPAFIPDQRAGIIGRSSTEPYVPAPRPEWLTPYQGPTVEEILPNLAKDIDKWAEEGEEASKTSLQGEAQETYDEETSSGQGKPDKHKSNKHLSSREEKIAARRALRDKTKENLEILKKRPNDKQVAARDGQLHLYKTHFNRSSSSIAAFTGFSRGNTVRRPKRTLVVVRPTT